MVTTLNISANRLNIVEPTPDALSYGFTSGIFKPCRTRVLELDTGL
ncbi:MAG: hypothetical protein QOF42_458 [Gammaproteobacteria bacterium]|jgi:hypothetical protein|nr:hypothetical protein [Gammaproteobacteria bacterium]